jgi:hypothetical protein
MNVLQVMVKLQDKLNKLYFKHVKFHKVIFIKFCHAFQSNLIPMLLISVFPFQCNLSLNIHKQLQLIYLDERDH